MRSLFILLLTIVSAWPVGQSIFVSELGSGDFSGSDTNNTWSAATFNSSTSWATSNDTNRIDPGDTVYFVGEIITPIRARGDATVSSRITFNIGAYGYLNCPTVPAWTFNGKDYLTLETFLAPDGKIPASNTDATKRGYLNFGGSVSDPAVNCIISGGSLSNKTGGNYVIGTQYSVGGVVENMVFQDIGGPVIVSGNGEGGAVNFTIRNNLFYGRDGPSTSQGDFISILVDEPLIEGNLFVMQQDKSGGDPHSDCIQIKGTSNSNGGERSKGGVIRNNWFLLRDCQDLSGGGDSFTQAFLAQYWWGDFVFSGNVIITYGHTTTGGNLVTFSRTHQNGSTVKVIGNTFITLANGHNTQLVFQPEGNDSPPSTMIAEVRNNIFANFGSSAGIPIVESLSSSAIGSSISFGPNAFIGGSSNARKVNRTATSQTVTFDRNVSISAQEGAIRFLTSDPLFYSLATNSFDLRYPTNSVLLDRGEFLSEFTQFITDARMSAFPDPSLSTRPNNFDLGAWELTDGSGPTNSPPVFTAHPASAARQVGESVTFTGVATGYLEPTYQWKKGGVSVSGQTNSSYTISSVSLSDAGTYRVDATNSEGTTPSENAVLVVTPTPQPSVPAPGVSARRKR